MTADSTNPNDRFQSVIKELAHEKRVSLKKLAEEIGITPVYLSQMINGHKNVPQHIWETVQESFGNLNKQVIHSQVNEDYPMYNPESATLFIVPDDSMSPRFEPGDQVIFSITSTPFLIPGKVYLLEVGGTKVLRKVLPFDQDEKFKAVSETTWYPDFYFQANEVKAFNIVTLIRKL